jgi:predicted secreted Zn-dependent protease
MHSFEIKEEFMLLKRFGSHHFAVIIGILLVCSGAFSMRNTYDSIPVSAQPTVKIAAPSPKSPSPVAAQPSAGSQQPIVASTPSQQILVPGCSKGSIGEVVLPNVSLSTPGISQNTTTSTYTIHGLTIPQISQQIHSCTPVTQGNELFTASTTYRMTWVYSVAIGNNGLCTIDRANVGLGIHYTMPSLEQIGLSASVSQQWQTFYTNLSSHEQGHATIARRYTDTLYNNLLATPPTDCDQIVSKVTVQNNAIQVQLDTANEQYDASTNHGETQGAHL